MEKHCFIWFEVQQTVKLIALPPLSLPSFRLYIAVTAAIDCLKNNLSELA